MKRFYLFLFLAAWMFSACSTTGDSVKTEEPAENPPAEVQATGPEPATEPEAGQTEMAETQPETAEAQTEMAETQPETAEATTDAAPADDNTFQHSGIGFSITKPEGWQTMSKEMVQASRDAMKWNDEQLEKMVKENGNAPLVVFTRHQEPYPTLNPSVSVTVVNMPMEGVPPKDVLKMSTDVLKRQYPDLAFVEEVQDVQVDGIPSAYAKVKYTIAAGDQQFPTLTRMWLVPRGKVMFTLGMSGPQDGPDVSEESFQQILDSVKIEK
ncbi:MAG: hypothetical protein GWM98_25990 [Nitrospinaceae bacterium]|nr:hypothetical protein [Nitrospinaceae bacterium]NIR53597.1 hypothetical protein [Nitrospinaceae bacterium]NIS84000.1 hypothetical protein [Nitrospinaceae bacterium]NIT84609.1 hypothetical protein [Nitrospinaceae bacterium]NIU43113.1 hypothetical protein [Nitrospinaceae bacterium]